MAVMKSNVASCNTEFAICGELRPIRKKRRLAGRLGIIRARRVSDSERANGNKACCCSTGGPAGSSVPGVSHCVGGLATGRPSRVWITSLEGRRACPDSFAALALVASTADVSSLALAFFAPTQSNNLICCCCCCLLACQ